LEVDWDDTITLLNVTVPEPDDGDIHNAWTAFLKVFDTCVKPFGHDDICRTPVNVSSKVSVPAEVFALLDTVEKLPIVWPDPTIKANPLKQFVTLHTTDEFIDI